MPHLLNRKEAETLNYWSFTNEFATYRGDFVHHAAVVYDTLKKKGLTPDCAEDLLEDVTAAIRGSPQFRAITRRKTHLQPALYDVMANGLAKKLLDLEWSNISGG